MSAAIRGYQIAQTLTKTERNHWPVAAGAPVPGAGVTRVAVGVFDPTGNTAQRPTGAYALGCTIPAGAIIVRVVKDVITTFTSAGGDAGTIALHAEAGNDIETATAISAGGNVWDKAISELTLTGGLLKTTVDRQITATVAGQNLTAGKMYVYVEYVLGQAA